MVRRRVTGTLVTCLVATAGLSAHEARGLASEAMRRWTWEPFTLALLALAAGVYAVGIRNLWHRAGSGRGVRVWQTAAFAAGLLSLAVALISPVAWLSEILFSVHMTQHEILMLISAPLFVFGHPLLALLWAVPRPTRESWRRWSQHPAVARTWRRLTEPLAVFLLHGVAIWVWHIPAMYEAALRNDGIHALEHLSFVVTGALFWWGMVHGRYGRIGYGVAVLYVFLTAVHTSILGALMTIAPGVWYPSYAAAATARHLNPLEDQQLAGLLMWVPSGVIFIVFGLALFAAWLGESDRRVLLGRIDTQHPSARRSAILSRGPAVLPRGPAGQPRGNDAA
jgi:putative membrane protein